MEWSSNPNCWWRGHLRSGCAALTGPSSHTRTCKDPISCHDTSNTHSIRRPPTKRNFNRPYPLLLCCCCCCCCCLPALGVASRRQPKPPGNEHRGSPLSCSAHATQRNRRGRCGANWLNGCVHEGRAVGLLLRLQAQRCRGRGSSILSSRAGGRVEHCSAFFLLQYQCIFRE